MIRVIIASTEWLSFEDARRLPLVTKEDVIKAARFLKESDKTLNIVSAYLKRKYVGEWRLTKNGKPVAKGVYFNVSHCEGMVAIALAEREVGVDVENVRPIDQATIDYATSVEEKAFVKTYEDFFKLWTSKESLVKAEGEGFVLPPKDIPALPIEGIKSYKNEVYYSRSTVVDGVALSVAARRGAFEWEIEKELLK